jgi:hypothetical protein
MYRLVNGASGSHGLFMAGLFLRKNAMDSIRGQGNIAAPQTDDQETGRFHEGVRRNVMTS